MTRKNTRKDKAQELMRLLTKGPSMSLAVFGCGPNHRRLTNQEEADINSKISLWHDTWVIPLVKALVPELKED